MDMEPDGPELPEPSTAPRIGKDEWVASHESRRQAYTGPIGAIRTRIEALPQPVMFAVFGVLAALVPVFSNNG
jgi:hypothetical protein